MATLEITDKTFAVLQQRAAASGLTVGQWLAVESGIQQPNVTGPERLSNEEWNKLLDQWIALHPPTGMPMDDSRESIYD